MKCTTHLALLALLALVMISCLGGGGADYFTLTMEIQGQGTVTYGEGAHRIARGTVVTVEATAAEDWEFSHWAGEVTQPNQAKTTVEVD